MTRRRGLLPWSANAICERDSPLRLAPVIHR